MTVMTDTDLQPGARNAIRVCLNVQPHERVTLITDDACRDIAEALAREIEAVGAPYRQFVLEREGARPLQSLPATIAADMEQSAVSIFAAHAQANELGSRMQMTDIVNRRRMRHAHMVNINRQIMLEGMRADYGVVDRISRRVLEIVQPARTIRATTPAGTDMTATLNPAYRWIKTSGLISPEKWGNLPGGEVFTTPGEVNGTLVIDGVVGDWLCDRYGNLERTPLTLRIEKNRLVDAQLVERQASRRLLDVHAHGREQRPRRRVRDRHERRAAARHRPHPAGREISRHPHRVRQSLRRAYRRRLVFLHAHRRRRHQLRHLGR